MLRVNFIALNPWRRAVIVIAAALLFAASGECLAAPQDIRPLPGKMSARIERLNREARGLVGEDWRIERVDEKIDLLQGEIKLLDIENNDAADEDLQEYANLLKRFLEICENYRIMLNELNELDENTVPLISERSNSYLSSNAPFSVLFYDEVRNECEILKRRMENSIGSVRILTDELEARISNFKKQENALNALKRESENPEINGSSLGIESVTLEIDTVQTLISMLSLKNMTDYYEIVAGYLARTSELRDYVRKNIIFGKADLDSILAGINNEIRECLSQQKVFEETIGQSIQELDSFGADVPSDFADTSERMRRLHIYHSAGSSAAAARYALANARFFVENFKFMCVQDKIDFLTEASHFWRYRHKIMAGIADGSDFWRSRSEAGIAFKRLESKAEYIQYSIEDLEASRAIIAKQAEISPSGEVDAILKELLAVFDNAIIHTLSYSEQAIIEHRSITTAILEETAERSDSIRVMQRISVFLSGVRDAFVGHVVLSGDGFELTAYELAVAAIIVTAGYFISAAFAKRISRMRRFSQNPVSAMIASKIYFYLIWGVFIVAALWVMEVPLTAFAFMGGALAIAVGFGSQDICKNLIGGLIILVDRPFKHHDILEIDGLSGKVQDIGIRSTRIVMFDGIDIAVPNSIFMNSKIINRTRFGLKTLNQFQISVSASADLDKTETVLRDIIKGYNNEEMQRSSFVVISAIDSNKVSFDLHYWVDETRSSSLKVGGRLKKEVFLKLRENDIPIAP
ncbi:MAG: mechanosensitive ion channel family protein [Synergistaceae bacterium]|jgi:small-conductance mechanosensitive channel|nr:mechanosensitive ion channel family protein [Synergistaceae bacterium]